MKIKFKIIKAHWRMMAQFGFKVDDESGYWYFLRVIYPDGEKKTYNRPFRSFSEPLRLIVEYLSRLRVKKILTEKAESEIKTAVLAQKEKIPKDPKKTLHVVGSITTIIGTPIGIGIGVYGLVKQSGNTSEVRSTGSSEAKVRFEPEPFDDIRTEGPLGGDDGGGF